MSALPPKADIRQRIEHVCFVPLADLCTRSKTTYHSITLSALSCPLSSDGLEW